MNTDLETCPKFVRPAMLLAALASCGLLIWLLFDAGHFPLSANGDVLILAVWILGGLMLISNPQGWQRLGAENLILLRGLWCNVGAVSIALLVPDMLRFLFLSVPLFGVLYAAVHLSTKWLAAVVAATVLTYIFHVAALFDSSAFSVEFEIISSLAFATLLGVAVVVGAGIQSKQKRLVERNVGLRDAMQRLQELALKDELTGLHNRRSIIHHLQRQKALADRGQPSFALCYCDLDYFKRVNDEFGHAVGDATLRQFAIIASAEVRNIDFVARFGGEEFLLVLVDTDSEKAAQVAQRLADRTHDMQAPGLACDFSLSVSIGVASYRPGEPIDDLIKRADRTLYAAKNAGRDQVLVAPL